MKFGLGICEENPVLYWDNNGSWVARAGNSDEQGTSMVPKVKSSKKYVLGSQHTEALAQRGPG